MKTLVTLIILLSPLTSFAEIILGSLRGNGGHIVRCQNGESRFLDYYEATHSFGMNLPPFQPADSDEFQKTQGLLQRLAEYDRPLAQTLLSWLKEFPAETQWRSWGDVNSTGDAGFFLPPDCKPQQLIIQNGPGESGLHRYQIDPLKWQALMMDEKATAILHELVYRAFMSDFSFSSTSKKVRLFVIMVLRMQTSTPPGQFEYENGKKTFLSPDF